MPGVTRDWVRVTRNQNRWQDGRVHPLIVVWIDAHILLLGVERIFTHVKGLEFVMILQIRPSENAAVDHVRQSLSMGYLHREKNKVKVGCVRKQSLLTDNDVPVTCRQDS